MQETINFGLDGAFAQQAAMFEKLGKIQPLWAFYENTGVKNVSLGAVKNVLSVGEKNKENDELIKMSIHMQSLCETFLNQTVFLIAASAEEILSFDGAFCSFMQFLQEIDEKAQDKIEAEIQKYYNEIEKRTEHAQCRRKELGNFIRELGNVKLDLEAFLEKNDNTAALTQFKNKTKILFQYFDCAVQEIASEEGMWQVLGDDCDYLLTLLHRKDIGSVIEILHNIAVARLKTQWKGIQEVAASFLNCTYQEIKKLKKEFQRDIKEYKEESRWKCSSAYTRNCEKGKCTIWGTEQCVDGHPMPGKCPYGYTMHCTKEKCKIYGTIHCIDGIIR